MSKYSATRSRRLSKLRKTALKMLIGGRCIRCGEKRFSQLVFHHIEPRTWDTKGQNQRHAAMLLVQDWLNGSIVLECKECHKRPHTAYDEAPIPE